MTRYRVRSVVALLAGVTAACVARADPLDPSIAAGPETLVVTMNFTISLRTKGAPNTVDSFRLLVEFFGAGDVTFDPRVIFDPHGQRFIATATSGRDQPYATLHVAVSKSDRPGNLDTGPEPAADWWVFEIDPDPLGTANAFYWLDFPQVGVDTDYVYITGRLVGGVEWIGRYITKLWVLPKNDFYAGGPLTVYEAGGYPPTVPIAGSVIAPSINFDGAGQYLVEHGPWGSIGLVRVDVSGGVVSLTRTNLSVPPIQPVATCAARGGEIVIAQGVAVHTVQRDGRLWMAHDQVGGAGASVRWLEVDPVAPAIVQIGTISDPVICYGYPGVQVDSAGNVWFVMAGTNAGIAPSIYHTVHLASDPPNTTRPVVQLKSGTGHLFTPPQVQRWADFAGIATDPISGEIWMLHQYNLSKNPYQDVWATRTGPTVNIRARRLSLRDGPAARRGTLRSNDPNIRIAWWDPTANGASLTVYNAGGGDAACLELPAAGWKRTNASYRFDGARVAGSPVVSVILREGSLKIRIRGNATHSFAYSLDEAAQGSVAARLSSAGLEVCMVAEGNSVLLDHGAANGGKFVAQDMPAPFECPVPAPCS